MPAGPTRRRVLDRHDEQELRRVARDTALLRRDGLPIEEAEPGRVRLAS